MDHPYVDHSGPATVQDARWSNEPRPGLHRELAPGTVVFEPADVAHEVAHAFGMSVELLLSPERTRHVSEARDAAAWLLFGHTRMGFEALSRALGRNDHSTALRACQRAAKRRQEDSWFRDVTDRLERKLEQKAKGVAA